MLTKRTSYALATAGFMLAVAAGLKYAGGLGVIGDEAVRRGVQVMIGETLAVYGNFIPKDIGSISMPVSSASCSRSPRRLGGWLLTLTGVGYAGVWAFAPIAIANVAAMPLLAAAILITVGYSGWVVLNCRWLPRNR